MIFGEFNAHSGAHRIKRFHDGCLANGFASDDLDNDVFDQPRSRDGSRDLIRRERALEMRRGGQTRGRRIVWGMDGGSGHGAIVGSLGIRGDGRGLDGIIGGPRLSRPRLILRGQAWGGDAIGGRVVAGFDALARSARVVRVVGTGSVWGEMGGGSARCVGVGCVLGMRGQILILNEQLEVSGEDSDGLGGGLKLNTSGSGVDVLAETNVALPVASDDLDGFPKEAIVRSSTIIGIEGRQGRAGAGAKGAARTHRREGLASSALKTRSFPGDQQVA